MRPNPFVIREAVPLSIWSAAASIKWYVQASTHALQHHRETMPYSRYYGFISLSSRPSSSSSAVDDGQRISSVHPWNLLLCNGIPAVRRWAFNFIFIHWIPLNVLVVGLRQSPFPFMILLMESVSSSTRRKSSRKDRRVCFWVYRPALRAEL